MPLYEYECNTCARRFEVIQKFSDPLVEICPTCGGVVHKLMSSPAIQFKGTGWYITDYAKKDGVGAGRTDGSKEHDGSKEKEGSKEQAKSEPDKSGPAKESTPKAEAASHAAAASSDSAPKVAKPSDS